MMPLEGGRRFRLGVNYWPAHVGMRWWQRFDLEAVAADFARIRNGKLKPFTIDRLMTVLNKLGQQVDVQIDVHPRPALEKAPAHP